MGKGRPRAVEKGVLGQNLNVLSSSSSAPASCSSSPPSLHVPPAPVYSPSEEEFRDPLEYIYKIRPEAEKFGICKIVPPKSWAPPFALDLDSFSFPTKSQAIHQLQARPASCDSKTFELEYNRFLEGHCGKKLKRRVVFEGEELDLCKLFNAVKRFGGYDKVLKGKKWGKVFKFVRSGRKVSECAKHVLSQLYCEHLYDYEVYYNQVNKEVAKSCKRGILDLKKNKDENEFSCSKRRRKNGDGEKVRVCNKVEEEELDQICEQCKSGLHGEVMLLCDRCNKGWHIYCLSPPLKQVPPGNWYCFECLNSDKDSFGFVPGKRYTVEAFRRLADRAKKKWLGSGSTSRVQMEKKFWEIVEGSAGEVQVMYGSDLDTSVYGSGFPRTSDQRPDSVDADLWNQYCGSPWNLNNLPKLKGSMLRNVHNNITGVMVPWLYVGMLFSSFCWHFEDHCFYSMNYLHWGEPKCWYSVPGSEASAFEKVMRNSLPDLFDTQPDLLFQLVTMLNPSVLQENGVSVYSVLQEPGNFIITFPRSYHGGFNFGLNCAEAVNFAPADWLPHGGFGSELYQMYHKTAVLSHEELLCVAAKGDHDSKAPPYLRKELLRIYTKEKTWREKLWRSGIIKSSPMAPRKCPDFVGTEEDPTCIICKQYLYLSAVVCCCRPSAFVCLEHWGHICECKSSRLRLLYRHNLAELYNLVLKVDKFSFEEAQEGKALERQIPCPNEPIALTKKVKGGLVSLAQVAEEWLLHSCKIFQDPYCSDTFVTLLKEAEQLLWAGSEMDPVRDTMRSIKKAQKWAEGIRDCLSKIQNWSCGQKRVHIKRVNELLNFDPMPCNEPGHLKLKEYAEDARLLIQDIDFALSSCSKICELESLYSRACNCRIYVEESKKLKQKIASAKVWVESARKCVSDKGSGVIDVDILYKLKSEILELQVQFPETDLLLDILKQAELYQARCSEMVKAPNIEMWNVEMLLKELENFPINFPELILLKQYHVDAVSWVGRFNDILLNIHQREDQHKVVDELSCLLKEGASLRIQVDKLPLLEVELKKACCREKALKGHKTKMPLEFMQQLMVEAAVLQIEREKLFADISEVLAAARHWEGRALELLTHEAQMSDFEDLLRSSVDISMILPSLEDVKDAVAIAKSWLKISEAFLVPSSSMTPGCCSLRNIGTLKNLVLQSKSLKISLEERGMLETVLKNCDDWEQVACSALQDADRVLQTNYTGDEKSDILSENIKILVTRIESILKAGLSLGFNFLEIPKLQSACAMLQWCTRALSFCSITPSTGDVESLMEAVEGFSVTHVSGTLWGSLVDGVKWLNKALRVFPVPSNFERCKLSDVEELLAESQGSYFSFPATADQLVNAVEKHKSWQAEVDLLFGRNAGKRSWSQLLRLKELGKSAAFSCTELDMVLSEVGKVQSWKQRCIEVVGRSEDVENPLLGALQKIKQSLHLAFHIYGISKSFARTTCMGCTGYDENQKFLTCSTCKDCYHLRCLGPGLVDVDSAGWYICSYCRIFKDGCISQNGDRPLRFRGRQPELTVLIELLSEAENFSSGIEERDTLQQIVVQALECKRCLTEKLDSALSYLDKDFTVVSQILAVALKATDISGVYDHQGNCKLEVALAKNLWSVRVSRLLEGLQKPKMQEIQQHLKEGELIKIPPEDYFWLKLTGLNHTGVQWAEIAKKVASDSGALGLDGVYELISEGESLPVHLEKELKLLRARTMLYCICRKPHDNKAKVTCNQCDEWYHIECLKLAKPPKFYVCAACNPQTVVSYTPLRMDHGRSATAKFVEPKTPSPRNTKSRKKRKKTESSSVARKKLAISDDSNNCDKIRRASVNDQLRWRNRKPFRRVARKRTQLDCLSPLIPIQQQQQQHQQQQH